MYRNVSYCSVQVLELTHRSNGEGKAFERYYRSNGKNVPFERFGRSRSGSIKIDFCRFRSYIFIQNEDRGERGRKTYV